jgi:hypothetical protein
MMKVSAALLVASALVFAPAASIAAPNDRGGDVKLDGSTLTLTFANRGDCQSTAAKLRNGIRGLVSGANSTVNAVAKPITNVVCQGSTGNEPVETQVDLLKVPGITRDDLAEIAAFIKENF